VCSFQKAGVRSLGGDVLNKVVVTLAVGPQVARRGCEVLEMHVHRCMYAWWGRAGGRDGVRRRGLTIPHDGLYQVGEKLLDQVLLRSRGGQQVPQVGVILEQCPVIPCRTTFEADEVAQQAAPVVLCRTHPSTRMTKTHRVHK
jgi:hypothetical protein